MAQNGGMQGCTMQGGGVVFDGPRPAEAAPLAPAAPPAPPTRPMPRSCGDGQPVCQPAAGLLTTICRVRPAGVFRRAVPGQAGHDVTWPRTAESQHELYKELTNFG